MVQDPNHIRHVFFFVFCRGSVSYFFYLFRWLTKSTSLLSSQKGWMFLGNTFLSSCKVFPAGGHKHRQQSLPVFFSSSRSKNSCLGTGDGRGPKPHHARIFFYFFFCRGSVSSIFFISLADEKCLHSFMPKGI